MFLSSCGPLPDAGIKHVRSRNKDITNVGEQYAKQFGSDVTVKKLEAGDSMAEALVKEVAVLNYDHIIGAEFQPSKDFTMRANAFFNGYTNNGEAIAMNYLLNALARQFAPNLTLTAGIKIFPPDDEEIEKTAHLNSLAQALAYAFPVSMQLPIGMACMTMFFINHLVRERAVGAKHLQIVSGVRAEVFWLAHFMGDMLVYLPVVGIMLIVIQAFDNPAFGGDNLGYTFLILLLYGWALFPNIYLMQFLWNSPPTAAVLFFVYSFMAGGYDREIVLDR